MEMGKEMEESAGDRVGDTYSISSGECGLSVPLRTGTSSRDNCTEWAVVVEGGAGDRDLDLTRGFDAVSVMSVGFGLFWRCRFLGPIVIASALLLLRLPMVLPSALLLLCFRWFELVVALAVSLRVASHRGGWGTEGDG